MSTHTTNHNDDLNGLDEGLARYLGIVDDDHDGLRWLNDIACAEVDPSAMFVEAGHMIDPEILEMCRACPVRRECLIHAYTRAIKNGHFAGLSPSQRRRMTLEEALEYIENDPPKAKQAEAAG